MKLAATRQLFEYWNTLRGQRASPERNEIDPAAIRGVLADTFILDVDDARTYPFRLSGTRTNALFDCDLKARSFVSLWPADRRAEISRVLAGVCDDVVGVFATVEAVFPGREPVALELLLLPIRYFGKTHARMLGCLAPAAVPRWLGLIAPDHLRLVGFRIVSAATERDKAEAAPRNAFRLAPAAEPGQPTTRGHLLVYEGGISAMKDGSAHAKIMAR